jgi:hypothetical protein
VCIALIGGGTLLSPLVTGAASAQTSNCPSTSPGCPGNDGGSPGTDTGIDALTKQFQDEINREMAGRERENRAEEQGHRDEIDREMREMERERRAEEQRFRDQINRDMQALENRAFQGFSR